MARIGAEPSETMIIEDIPSGVKAAATAHAACVVGIYGDSDKKLLQNAGVCDYLIEDYMEPLFVTKEASLING